MIIRRVYQWTYFIFLLESLLLLYGIYAEHITYIKTDVAMPLMATRILFGVIIGTLLRLVIWKPNTPFRKVMAIILSISFVFLCTYYLMEDQLRVHIQYP